MIDTFKQKVGPPIDQKSGEIRTIIVMVANEGVYDLLLNFLCSIDNIGTVNNKRKSVGGRMSARFSMGTFFTGEEEEEGR